MTTTPHITELAAFLDWAREHHQENAAGDCRLQATAESRSVVRRTPFLRILVQIAHCMVQLTYAADYSRLP